MSAKWFRFESKFGWSEVIAAIALVLAAAAWQQSWTANRPSVQLAKWPARIGPVHDLESDRYVYIGLIPLIFTNAGGRATTLLTLRANEDLPPTFFTANRGLILEQPRNDLFLVDKNLETSEEWREFLPRRTPLEPDRRVLLNRVVRPGEPVTLFVGITADVYDGLQRTADTLLVALDAEFEDGSVLPIRASISIPPIRRGH